MDPRGASSEAVVDREDFINRELDLLREELASLKECQVRYFWSSVTVTGVLIGLGSRLEGQTAALIFVSPLFVILPCWIVFFDKATTITRIVGYFRVLEYELLTGTRIHHLLGWENSLAFFRKKQCDQASMVFLDRVCSYLRAAAGAMPILVGFQRAHRYWSVSWLTFFGLAAIASGLAWTPQAEGYVAFKFLVMAIAVVVAVHNAYMLEALAGRNGRFSYDTNEKTWHEYLSSEEARDYLEGRFGGAGPLAPQHG